MLNLLFRLQGKPFRTFVHSAQSVDRIICGQGFKRQFYWTTMIWQVVVYSRM
jgi:hypothetical protein